MNSAAIGTIDLFCRKMSDPAVLQGTPAKPTAHGHRQMLQLQAHHAERVLHTSAAVSVLLISDRKFFSVWIAAVLCLPLFVTKCLRHVSTLLLMCNYLSFRLA